MPNKFQVRSDKTTRLGALLLKTRKDRDWTLEDVVREWGFYSTTGLSNVERGTIPTPAIFLSLCEKLGVEPTQELLQPVLLEPAK